MLISQRTIGCTRSKAGGLSTVKSKTPLRWAQKWGAWRAAWPRPGGVTQKTRPCGCAEKSSRL